LTVIVAFVVLLSPLLRAHEYQTQFPSDEFKASRARVFDGIGGIVQKSAATSQETAWAVPGTHKTVPCASGN
jgi:hypothetical protein